MIKICVANLRFDQTVNFSVSLTIIVAIIILLTSFTLHEKNFRVDVELWRVTAATARSLLTLLQLSY